MSPLGGAALRAAGAHAPCAHVRKELLWGGGGGGLGVGAPDVDAGVVVGAADADGVAGGDVGGGGAVELGRAGAVADLPDAEQLGQAPAVPGGEWRGADGVVGVGERAGDLALVHVGGAQLDVAARLPCSHSWSAGVMS